MFIDSLMLVFLLTHASFGSYKYNIVRLDFVLLITWYLYLVRHHLKMRWGRGLCTATTIIYILRKADQPLEGSSNKCSVGLY